MQTRATMAKSLIINHTNIPIVVNVQTRATMAKSLNINHTNIPIVVNVQTRAPMAKKKFGKMLNNNKN